jgi:mannose-6-phosphate isomerase-like protein (cupin superfamily)
MAFVNDYKFMDIFNAIDLHTGAFIIKSRIYVGSSFDGGAPDYGQCQKRVFNTERLSLLSMIPDPGMQYPSVPGYVYNKNDAEFGYIVHGTQELSYPDGKKYEAGPGTCFEHEKGQPHRMCGIVEELGATTVVFYTNLINKVSRAHWPIDKPYKGKNGYKVFSSTDVAATKGSDPLMVEKVLTESNKLSVVDVTMKPGCHIPEKGFITNSVDQIILILSGNGAAVYPDKCYALKEEHAAYHRSGQPYNYINTGSDDLHMLVAYSADKLSDVERKVIHASHMI